MRVVHSLAVDTNAEEAGHSDRSCLGTATSHVCWSDPDIPYSLKFFVQQLQLLVYCCFSSLHKLHERTSTQYSAALGGEI